MRKYKSKSGLKNCKILARPPNMDETLEFCDMAQNKLDPFLFIKETVIAITCLGNIVMRSTKDLSMINLHMMLNKEGVDLEEENDTAGLLGEKLTKPQIRSIVIPHSLVVQEDLIDHIIEALSIDFEHPTLKSTSYMKSPLTKILNGGQFFLFHHL